jgi:hypothetical protein
LGRIIVVSNKEKRASWFVLGTEELRAITARAVTRAFPKNAIILSEGDRAERDNSSGGSRLILVQSMAS